MDGFERINMLKKELLKPVLVNRPTYEDLALRDEKGKTLFEYIIDHKIDLHRINSLMEDITNNYDYLAYMIKHDVFPNEYYNYDLLFDSSKGPTIIELLFKKQKSTVLLFPEKVLRELFVNRNGKYLIENLIKKDVLEGMDIIEKIDDPELLIRCLRDINRLDLLKYAKRCMAQKLPNGQTLLEILSDANSSLSYIDHDSVPCAEIIYNLGKYNKLIKFSPQILLNYPSKDNNYLNILINKYKDGEKIDFTNLDYFSIDFKNMAVVLITLLKNNIPIKKPYANTLVPIVTGDTKPLLVHMLELDYDLTMKNFVTDEVIDALKKYVKDIVPKEQKDSIDNLSFEELLSHLPSREKLEKEINNGKKRITDLDLYSDDYLKPFGGEKTFLEYALKNNINIRIYIPDTIEAIMLFLKYKGNIAGGIREKLLYEKLDTGELLIDYLMNNHYERIVMNSVNNDKRILEYCEKYNNYSLIKNSNIMTDLFVFINGSCDAEQYLNNDKFIDAMKSVTLSERQAINLFNKGYYKALTHVKEHILLKKINDKTILESLLENNIEPSFSGYDFEQVETIRLLYLYKKPHLMWNAKTSLLVNKPTVDNNYLQYMIDSYKKGIEVHFDDKDFFFQTNNKDIARCYIQMAKNGLLDLLEDLTEDNLLSTANGEKNSLLANLIEIDRDTTINKILGISLSKKPRINAALKILSRDGLINLPYERLDADEICRKKMNEMYADGVVCPCEDLLTELRELFVNDPDTDMRLVDALITSYRYATSVNPIFIEELKVLIEIKKKNPDFHYKRIDGGAYFDSESVCCDNATIGTLIHETGHAIHHYTANDEVPQGFYELIEKIKNSPEWIHKVANYSKKFHEIRKQINERATDIVKKVFAAHLTDEDEKEIDRLLTEEKEKIKSEYLKKGYSEEDLDVILTDTFTRKDFLAQKITIEIGEVEDFLMRHLYDAFIVIGDYIDGITFGKFRSKVLRDEDGELIPSTYGHGVRYYKSRYLIYCEMVANYSEIIKSKHSKEILNLLRRIVGDELVDMLDDFYKHRMLSLPQYEIEGQEEVAGRLR